MSHFPSDAYRFGAANRDLEEEALAWVVRLTSGDVTEEDQHEFDYWREDAENARAYRQATQLWKGLGPILEHQEAEGWPGVAPEPDMEAVAPGRRWRRMGLRGAWAAAAALIAILGVQYHRVWQYDEVSSTRVKTEVALADGSQAIMGPGTALNTDFANGARHVSLAHGEVYFDVKHDAKHPFVVSAGNGLVRVLGTAFTVRRKDDGNVTVTVARGRVQVTSGAQSAILAPDRQISFGANGLGPMQAVDASISTAWMRQRLIMENRPLGDVLAELDRYEDGAILLLNEEASQRRINAVIDLGRTDSWLTALASSQGLKLTQLGPVKILR